MIGCSTRSKGYKIWDVESSKLAVSRDVMFNEPSVSPPEACIQSNAVMDCNVADPGGESFKNVDSNIKLPSDSSE